MEKSVESVNYIVGKLRDWSELSKKQETTDELIEFASVLEQIAEEIVRLKGLTSALPPDLGNVHDLPSELLEELSIAKVDELEDQIVTVVNAYGGEANLDQILVGLFRKFKVSQKRRFLQNKLYRMSMVWPVSGRKGVYSTVEQADEDASPMSRSELADDPEPQTSNYSGYVSDDLDDEIPF